MRLKLYSKGIKNESLEKLALKQGFLPLSFFEDKAVKLLSDWLFLILEDLPSEKILKLRKNLLSYYRSSRLP